MEATQHNQKAWNDGTYDSWVNRFGTPKEASEKIKQDPKKRIGSAFKFMGESVEGKRIINLLGSNGNKAVALALLGAQVTVVDFSSENERYAMELARQAGVELKYIVSDVLQLPEHELANTFDMVFMEFGILHYFTDLSPLFKVVRSLLQDGGVLILQDFHPVTTKLISSKGTTANIRKHKVSGDYFETALVEKNVSHSKYADSEQVHDAAPKVYLRNWTLGEIVTAVASEDLTIKVLEELPNLSSEVFDKGIPKTFTVVAQK
ncbi:class I SAM-dependent methyltransferase [Paenibacillus rhizovicinus]|uniref:Class I SAM-dependent methyltransferase n=1 Tax=Paenibacillus rhizovicinus TaxID=2704463 RepID=A0A6C0NXJ3_9BACL|nr:class I SAM-dependent methyltransferase [Paenibacillus rhizovicinus]QHW30908.1 class I SAM-dependent methyltransferase [Paenibacillus rhizovicinus]